MDRRDFLELGAGGLAATAAPGFRHALAGAHKPYRAIAFDGFPILDPRPIAALAESLYPGRGTALMNAWRVRQFDYQWLRTLGGRYADFLEVTRESLIAAARQAGLELDPTSQGRLLAAWTDLQVWPDVPGAVRTLREAGLRLAFLSNMTAPMLTTGLRNGGVAGDFEAVLSTDRARAFKPAPAAYQLAVDHFGLPKEEILFVAFAGWDLAGAKWFGYPAFWVNRAGAPREELGVTPEGEGPGLDALVTFVQGSSTAGAPGSPAERS